MSIDQVDQNSRGEITRPPNPLKEGDFTRTRRLNDAIEGRQPLKGIGVKVLSSDTIEYTYTDSEGNPGSIRLTGEEINTSNFWNPGDTPGTHQTIRYTPDKKDDKPLEDKDKKLTGRTDDEDETEWGKRFLSGMSNRISEEVGNRMRQGKKSEERLSQPLESVITDERELALTRLALNLLDIAETIRLERGFSEAPIMDKTFMYIFKGGYYSLTASHLRDILSGEHFPNSISIDFSNIEELGWREYLNLKYKIPTELTDEFMQKLGFLKPGQTFEEAKRSTNDKSGAITIVKAGYIGTKFQQGYISIKHPTLPFIARCYTEWSGGTGKLLIEAFDITYEPPNKNRR